MRSGEKVTVLADGLEEEVMRVAASADDWVYNHHHSHLSFVPSSHLVAEMPPKLTQSKLAFTPAKRQPLGGLSTNAQGKRPWPSSPPKAIKRQNREGPQNEDYGDGAGEDDQDIGGWQSCMEWLY